MTFWVYCTTYWVLIFQLYVLRWQLDIVSMIYHRHDLFFIRILNWNIFFCFVSFYLCMIEGSCIHVFLRVTVLINCDISNTILWRLWGLKLSFIMFSVIYLRTSELEVICYFLASKSGWVLLRYNLFSQYSGTFINLPLNIQKSLPCFVLFSISDTPFIWDNVKLLCPLFRYYPW